MPFIGEDWRAPGQKWIRTAEGGWRPLSDLHRALSVQLANHFAQFAPSIARTSAPGSSSRRSRSKNRGHKTRNSTSPTSGRSSPENKPNLSSKAQLVETCSQKDEGPLSPLHFLLSMKSVSVGRSTSRESNRYSTISDAVQKLSFHVALQDSNCFPFICKVLALIFANHYQSASGSLQATLLRLTEAAKETAVENRQHSGLVVRVIERALTTNEKIRKSQLSGYGLRNIDSRIKSLLKMKHQLQDSQLQPITCTVTSGGTELLDLPDDCLYLIMSYLTSPRDILNLGQTSSRLHHLTGENTVWRGLTTFHYSRPDGLKTGTPWSEVFITQYRLSGGELKGEQSSAVCLCKTCKRVFWKSYGHPCSVNANLEELEWAANEVDRLTAQKFMNFFPH